MPGREGIPRSSSSFRTIALLTTIPVVGLLLVAGWLLWTRTGPSPEQVVSSRRRAAVPPPVRAALTGFNRPERTGPAIAIIIDDIGYDSHRLERAMAIDPNLNFAVLPNSSRGALVAEHLNGRGFEILCHLPMEPTNARISPGQNAVLTSMSDRQIVQATRANIAAVPHARGVNNHMGSLATADRRVMTDVIGALPAGMYFIDSRTGAGSVAEEVARAMKVKTATRQVFLDDVQTEESVIHQLALLSARARERGVAIGIGHPHDVTLRVLAREVPQLRARGFRFVRASEVVN